MQSKAITTWLSVLMSAALVLGAVWLAGLSVTRSADSGQVPIPDRPITINPQRTIGSSRARLVMIEYSDFECPSCGRFTHDILPGLRNEFVNPGLLRIVFKHFPLETIHRSAFRASQLAECAARVDRFESAHDSLFGLAQRKAMSQEGLKSLASTLGIDGVASCVSDKATTDAIRADQLEGRSLGVQSTPTFMLGLLDGGASVRIKTVFVGAHPLAAFVRALRALND
jgi:protein-disulfide isomerase